MFRHPSRLRSEQIKRLIHAAICFIMATASHVQGTMTEKKNKAKDDKGNREGDYRNNGLHWEKVDATKYYVIYIYQITTTTTTCVPVIFSLH